MIDQREVPREVVQTILAMATEGGPVPVPPPILAALCRAWLALYAGAPAIMDTRAALSVCAPTEADFPALYALQGQRVRIVKENQSE